MLQRLGMYDTTKVRLSRLPVNIYTGLLLTPSYTVNPAAVNHSLAPIIRGLCL